MAPGGGFPAHGHRDMEIISCVLGGAEMLNTTPSAHWPQSVVSEVCTGGRGR